MLISAKVETIDGRSFVPVEGFSEGENVYVVTKENCHKQTALDESTNPGKYFTNLRFEDTPGSISE